MIRRNSIEFTREDIYQRRQKIIGESYNPEEDEDYSPPYFEKSQEEKKILQRNLRNHFLFKTITEETLNSIVNAMFRVDASAGEVVIREGEEGDYFYCIQRGMFEVDKLVNGERKLLGYYEHEGCFGELALMHRVGRAVSVTAARDGVLWALDRQTFQRTLLGNAFKRRSLYENMMNTFTILRSLTDKERADVVDCLIEETFHDGEVVFREGDPGTGMYWVIEGKVRLTTGEVELKTLGTGDYFGELALIFKKGRATTATAVGELRLAFLEGAAFERLLGPAVHLMRQRMPDYQAEMQKLLGTSGAKDVIPEDIANNENHSNDH